MWTYKYFWFSNLDIRVQRLYLYEILISNKTKINVIIIQIFTFCSTLFILKFSFLWFFDVNICLARVLPAKTGKLYILFCLSVFGKVNAFCVGERSNIKMVRLCVSTLKIIVDQYEEENGRGKGETRKVCAAYRELYPCSCSKEFCWQL